jgi:hypothetical protein
MNKKHAIKSVLIISLLFLLLSLSFQSKAEGEVCSLKGKVIDQITGKPIVGGSVVAIVESKVIKTRLDSHGEYLLNNIPINLVVPVQVNAQYYQLRQVMSIMSSTAGITVEMPDIFLLRKVCKLRGIVKDKITGKPIVGGAVAAIVEGRAISTKSNIYGAYRLDNIPIMLEFPIKVTSTGYNPVEVESKMCSTVGTIVKMPDLFITPSIIEK